MRIRVCGHLLSLLMTVKGLPLAYKRDLQEDKEPLFDTVDTVRGSVALMAGLLDSLTIRPERLTAALRGGLLAATDMADYLVNQGVPFRTAHEQVAIELGSLRIGSDTQDDMYTTANIVRG